MDCRVKHGNDSKKKSAKYGNDDKKRRSPSGGTYHFKVIFGQAKRVPEISLMDSRVKHGNDNIIFLVMFGLDPDISLMDSRVKHGNDSKKKSVKHGNDRKRKKSSPAMTVNIKVMFGLFFF